MINFIVIVILFIALGYIFNPYITSFISYVSYGLSQLLQLIDRIVLIITAFFDTLIQYNYIMLMLGITIAIVAISYIINSIGGSD